MNNQLRELSAEELMMVNGAWSLVECGAATAGGAVAGGMAGSIAPGVGTVAGAIGGGVSAGVGYTISELYKWYFN